ncbi:MAG: adenosylmethionine--8-amino-7-oxononanoate transaminase [Rikenellaceae bacterium]|jgi:adenosylmethionine-8-amino-7-oxononanoate aminotransferase|nr:adenosylmethionine--8-amino-7-oxononanoate transaminase [Rikenellaceae bacterium]
MEKNTTSDPLRFDRDHIWHPYTSMRDPLPVYPVASAEGVHLTLEDGRRLVDGMSSWWCAIHGYNHPVLNSAVEDQLRKMAHVMFGGLTHTPAVELARRLVAMAPGGLDRVFYCDSGSVAVEVAAKMAIQYMHALGKISRTSLATISGGYHGDTWHAMSVCDPVGGMHSLYTGRLPLQYFAPRPATPFGGLWDEADFTPMAQLLERHADRIAAVIVEPVVQGAGGMWFYHPQYLRRLRDECDRHDILLIFDEIATGFWRTGRLWAADWAADWAGVAPDVMCIGKALTGGYMSFAAVMASPRVADTISASPPHAFMHGPTFMGNPLAAAVSCASIDLLAADPPAARIAAIGRALEEGLAPLRGHKNVADVRVLGAIGVVELDHPVDMAAAQAHFVERGVWIRPFGKLVYVMPPYITGREELDLLTAAVRSAVECGF